MFVFLSFSWFVFKNTVSGYTFDITPLFSLKMKHHTYLPREILTDFDRTKFYEGCSGTHTT
jgi:hypothetical protein